MAARLAALTPYMEGVLEPMRSRPPIIEVAGPPGASKTTLARLMQIAGGASIPDFPCYRRFRDDPFFVKTGVAITPTLLRLYRQKQEEWLTPRDVALMAILQGWPVELERLAVKGGRPVILDEGCVSFFSKLHGFGGRAIRGRAAREWWYETYGRWAGVLDLLIVLEATPPTLLQRIRQRGLPHETDGLPAHAACEYLERIVAAQSQTISELATVPHAPEICRFNTELWSPEQIALSDPVTRWNRPS